MGGLGKDNEGGKVLLRADQIDYGSLSPAPRTHPPNPPVTPPHRHHHTFPATRHTRLPYPTGPALEPDHNLYECPLIAWCLVYALGGGGGGGVPRGGGGGDGGYNTGM